MRMRKLYELTPAQYRRRCPMSKLLWFVLGVLVAITTQAAADSLYVDPNGDLHREPDA